MSDFQVFEQDSMLGDQQDAITQLLGNAVISNEGKKIGKVEEIWLNDQTGGEGFISISTGWLFGRRCLIPVESLQVDAASRTIQVPYTEDKVKNAPDVAADYHVTSEEAMVVKQYYGVATSDTTNDMTRGNEIDDGLRGADQDLASTGMTTTDLGSDRPIDTGVMPTSQMDQQTDPTSADTRAMGTSDTQDTQDIPLSEESVQVGKRQVQSGVVRLRKVIRTEIVNEPVELKREDVVIERVDPSDTTQTGSAFTEDEIEVPLMREEAVVQKTSKVTGAVRVRKVSDTEHQDISETVRKEDVEVERNQGDATITETVQDKTKGKNKRA